MRFYRSYFGRGLKQQGFGVGGGDGGDRCRLRRAVRTIKPKTFISPNRRRAIRAPKCISEIIRKNKFAATYFGGRRTESTDDEPIRDSGFGSDCVARFRPFPKQQRVTRDCAATVLPQRLLTYMVRVCCFSYGKRPREGLSDGNRPSFLCRRSRTRLVTARCIITTIVSGNGQPPIIVNIQLGHVQI